MRHMGYYSDHTHTNSRSHSESRSTFYLSNYSRHFSVTSVKKALNLPELSLRRKSSRLNFFHKVYYYNDDFKDALFHPPHYISARTDHSYKVALPSCRTKLCTDSFVRGRTSVAWNHLPAIIASITDNHDFEIASQNALYFFLC